jgi:cysteine desulfurase/selenocysteine lyase
MSSIGIPRYESPAAPATAGPARPPAVPALDVEKIRRDFPILRELVHGRPLVYLDSAATSQTPVAVMTAVNHFETHKRANVHRGIHRLSELATEAYERARSLVQSFVGAGSPREIVFVRGTTEAINLVAQSYGRPRLGAGDEVVLTVMEHHSNIVPWQMLCAQTGARLRVAPISDDGELVMEEYERLLGPRTRLVAVTHVSNALGTVNPIRALCERAHACGALVLVDGAQAVPHLPVDVRALDCDFYAFSAHKMYGPHGVGVLYGKEAILEEMPPYQGGGDMIRSVTFDETFYNQLPYKFEAGTPNISGVVGLGAAIEYLEGLGRPAVVAHERALIDHALVALATVDGLRLVGRPQARASVVSFLLGDIHPHDIGTVLDRLGIAIRTGHHCAEPLMQRLGLAATARASLGVYSTRADVDALVAGLRGVQEVLGR